MKVLEKHKHRPWLWLLTGCALLFVWLFGFFLLISAVGGCDDEKYCEPGERLCHDGRVLQCDEKGHWFVWADCLEFESNSDLDLGPWECCIIDGESNCFPASYCETIGLYCKTLDGLQAYCEGGGA